MNIPGKVDIKPFVITAIPPVHTPYVAPTTSPTSGDKVITILATGNDMERVTLAAISHCLKMAEIFENVAIGFEANNKSIVADAIKSVLKEMSALSTLANLPYTSTSAIKEAGDKIFAQLIYPPVVREKYNEF